ncbi:MAG: glycosyltransferase family 9 protein [Phycisphaerae bacterium]
MPSLTELEKYRPLTHNVAVNDVSSSDAIRLLVIMPNWLGDGVMATPLLRSLANLPGRPQITALTRPLVEPVVTGMPYVHRMVHYQYHGSKIDVGATARMLAKEHFDAAIILPNNWRSALIAWRAGVPVRVGYERDGRRLLLTHHIQAALRKDDEISLQLQRAKYRRRVAQAGPSAATSPIPSAAPGRMSRTLRRWHNYQPVSTIEYYLKLLDILPLQFKRDRPTISAVGGTRPPADMPNRLMELFCSADERAAAEELIRARHIDGPYAMIFPGANFGASKCWPVERFAELAHWLAGGGAGRSWWVLLAGAPSELAALEEITRQAKTEVPGRIINLATLEKPTSLGTVKALAAEAGLVVCNDTGPRHFGAAFQRPLVTLFGPTDPRWAQTYDPCEQIVSIPVECGPCQLKVCPIDHRCMRGITVEMVQEAIKRAIEARRV